MTAFYNDTDPYAAEWLRRLIKAGHIAPGVVDERSITDLSPDDLKPYTQLHFFAGLGGWSRALRQAGWADDRPVWTGSCPCQPFSSSGKGRGFDDERHLWPSWFALINALTPATLFGEQVAAPAALDWFDLVSHDLETKGYQIGAADICAAGLGAPHIRQRLWFGATRGLANADGEIASARTLLNHPVGPTCKGSPPDRPGGSGGPHRVGHASRRGRGQARHSGTEPTQRTAHAGADDRLADANHPRSQGRATKQRSDQWVAGPQGLACRSPWTGPDWIWCQDGQWRPSQPGLCPLANGVSGRVGRLRAYGNAIVPQVASAFTSDPSA